MLVYYKYFHAKKLGSSMEGVELHNKAAAAAAAAAASHRHEDPQQLGSGSGNKLSSPHHQRNDPSIHPHAGIYHCPNYFRYNLLVRIGN